MTYPRQQKYSCTQAPQKVKITREKSYPCFIPGRTQRFKRSDSRGNHLRKKHGLPIEKGQWAKIWISKVENQEYYLAAVDLQAYTNNLPSQIEGEKWTQDTRGRHCLREYLLEFMLLYYDTMCISQYCYYFILLKLET